ncbi:hypothetical protein CYLTODRAFT_416684 [Cylindrobasidium torrendii FP15055 ss-10]|uniref:F-box domain-containing protein n=1 Tax=Cylindrobasidium torrendii FP15055 ss-10 TaxID=1314674 RepID=A0A0D7BTA0_9AGAR|nr:hypothetical protein CYLTODRAFT_416684 [Cylindrobasidium torrendii FP15055 ss-10]
MTSLIMDKLSIGILQTVFVFACVEPYALDHSDTSRSTLMLVCSVWKNAALSTPELWTHFRTSVFSTIPTRDEQRLTRLDQVIARCPDASLNVVLCSPSDERRRHSQHRTLPSPFMARLQKTAVRWVSLDITLERRELLLMKQFEGHLTTLEHVNIRPTPTAFETDSDPVPFHSSDLFSDAPRLRSVHCFYAVATTFNFPWRQLNEFSYSVMTKTHCNTLSTSVETGLSRATLLQEINFRALVGAGVVPRPNPTHDFMDSVPTVNIPSVRKISLGDYIEYQPVAPVLPSLEHLELTSFSRIYLVKSLIHRSGCSVTSLDLPRLLPAEQSKLEHISQELKGLKHLRIRYNSDVKGILHKKGRTNIALTSLFTLLTLLGNEQTVFPALETLDVQANEERYITSDWIAANYPINSDVLRALKIMVCSRSGTLRGVNERPYARVAFIPVGDVEILKIPDLAEFQASAVWKQLEAEYKGHLGVNLLVEQRYKQREVGLSVKTSMTSFRITLGTKRHT